MTRTVSLGPNGFVVSDDYEDMLSRFLNTNVLGDHADQLATLFAPDGEGFYIPSLGGAHRIEEREGLLAPNDEDPSLDPERIELSFGAPPFANAHGPGFRSRCDVWQRARLVGELADPQLQINAALLHDCARSIAAASGRPCDLWTREPIKCIVLGPIRIARDRPLYK